MEAGSRRPLDQTPVGVRGRGCGGRPGTREYLESLLKASREYAPWLADVLDFSSSRGLRVLDVGCGQGVELVRFLMEGADVTGVDLVQAHVEQARSHVDSLGLSAEIVVGDAEALPLTDRSFDRVVSANALQFTPDFDAALREIRRVLKPGGDVRIIVYHRDSAYYWLYFVLRRGILALELIRRGSMASVVSHNIPWASSDSAPLVRVQSRRNLRRALEAAGFRTVSTSIHGFSPESVVFTDILFRRLPRSRRAGILSMLDHTVGWYLAARAIR